MTRLNILAVLLIIVRFTLTYSNLNSNNYKPRIFINKISPDHRFATSWISWQAKHWRWGSSRGKGYYHFLQLHFYLLYDSLYKIFFFFLIRAISWIPSINVNRTLKSYYARKPNYNLLVKINVVSSEYGRNLLRARLVRKQKEKKTSFLFLMTIVDDANTFASSKFAFKINIRWTRI